MGQRRADDRSRCSRPRCRWGGRARRRTWARTLVAADEERRDRRRTSTSWAPSTSWTAPSSTACSPTATPPRPSASRATSVGGDGARRAGRRTWPGSGKTIAEKIDALLADGDDPRRREAQGEGSRRAWCRSPASPASGPKRASCCTTELGIAVARRAAPGRRGRAGCGRARLRRQGRGERAGRAGGRGRRRGQAAHAAVEGAGARRGAWWTACASTRPRSGWSWPAAPAAGPRPARTWTSWPAPATPRRWSRPSPSWPRGRGHQLGQRRARGRSPIQGMPVDLRIVPEESFGNLLQHFTGSGRHNEALRTAAVQRGLHVSEYGVADDETGDHARLRHRGGGLRAAGHGLRAARAARGPRRAGGGTQARAAGAAGADGHQGRPALAHRGLGRPQHDRRDGRGRAGARLRVPGDDRSLGHATGSATT